ncbi:hypothetical protein [Streptomyces sp. NPDC086182]|uniref:hypothetical protein n=1 Tax=Streptomyces sp. NPDC086182 TaxID=3155058 RepID=UPI0034378AD1
MTDNGNNIRVISRNFPDGGRIIIGLDDTTDPADDEALLDQAEADMNKRRLHAVDDPE